MSQNCVKAIEMIYYDTAVLNPFVYDVINELGFEEPCFGIRIINASDAFFDISFDGVIDHEYLEPYGDLTVNAQTNASPNNEVSKFSRGTKVYVRGTPGKFGGYIYLVGYYQPTN